MIDGISNGAGAERLLAMAEATTGASEEAAPGAGRAAAGDADFRSALGKLGREIDRGEKLVQRALRGGGALGASELIALQAGIYRYTEAVDLAAKLVDRASNAVRTTLQSSGG
jgi:hypothetical protein